MEEVEDDAEHDRVHQRLLLQGTRLRQREQDARRKEEEEHHHEQSAGRMQHRYELKRIYFFLWLK